MSFDNIIIHYYPDIECIAKCAVNLRIENKIVFRLVLKDLVSVNNWLFCMGYENKPHKLIIH